MECDQNIFWKLVPEWLSALGTLLAVIVALYLAHRDRLIRCLATATFDILYKSANANPPFVSIIVTNIGVRSFAISEIGWQSGIFKKRFFSINPPEITDSAKLPHKLTDGEQLDWYIPLDACSKIFIPKIIKGRMKYFASLWFYFLRLDIRMTTGKSFTFKIHNNLKKEIKQLAQNNH